MPLIAIVISVFAFFDSSRQATLVVDKSAQDSALVHCKLAIYDVLASHKQKGDPPLSLDVLRRDFQSAMPRFGADKPVSEDEFKTALLELMQFKVVIGRGDSTYTLLSEEHFAHPPDPNAKRLLDLIGLVLNASKVEEKISNFGGDWIEDVFQPPPPVTFQPLPQSTYNLEELLKEQILDDVDGSNGGIETADLYSRLKENVLLKEKGIVFKERHSADLLFQNAVNHLLASQNIKGEKNGRLRSVQEPDQIDAPTPPKKSVFELEFELKAEIVRHVDGSKGGIETADLYSYLKEKGLVFEDRYSADLLFQGALDELLRFNKLIKGDKNGKLFSLQENGQSESQ